MNDDLRCTRGWNCITGYLQAVKESLATTKITPELLIIEDLGLDSMDLTELAARIHADFGAIDFLPWLAQATAGNGTVASLAEFVDAAGLGAQQEDAQQEEGTEG